MAYWPGEDEDNVRNDFQSKSGVEGWLEYAPVSSAPRARETRREQLFIAPEYGVFLLAGPGEGISVKPFNELSENQRRQLKEHATQWSPSASGIEVKVTGRGLIFTDNMTGAQTMISLGELDPNVRRRLTDQDFGDTARGWGKYAATAFSSAVGGRVQKVAPVTEELNKPRFRPGPGFRRDEV